VASAWIERRRTADGKPRYLVKYRRGGSESRKRYAGSFRTMREATIRRAWVAGELAALRLPDLGTLGRDEAAPQTFAEAAKRWQASRVDVAEATRVQHRTALNRALPLLGSRRLAAIAAQDVARPRRRPSPRRAGEREHPKNSDGGRDGPRPFRRRP
jgi:hypothetical protein